MFHPIYCHVKNFYSHLVGYNFGLKYARGMDSPAGFSSFQIIIPVKFDVLDAFKTNAETLVFPLRLKTFAAVTFSPIGLQESF